MVEVPEAHALKCGLTNPHLQEQVEGDPVAAVVGREDRLFLICREGRSLRMPRFFGGLIARAGSPCKRSLSVAHSKNPFRIEMFFARVREARSPHCSSMNSSQPPIVVDR